MGLCSVPMVSNYECGKRMPDAVSFSYFMERIGASVEDFAIMATRREYEYFLWKEKVFEAIENKKWKVVDALLQMDVAKPKECNERIVLQFYYYAKGVYEVEENNNLSKATEYLKISIIQTNPRMFDALEEKYMFGSTELHIMILYLYYGVLSKELNMEDGKALFYKLEHYINSERMDLKEKSKIYPKLVCVGIHILEEKLKFTEKLALCEKAIELLRHAAAFFDITELLKKYISLLTMIDDAELSFYKKQYDVLGDMIKDIGIIEEFRPEIMNICKPKVYIIDEYLYSKRKEIGLTQEELSEKICEPESYSRIERGKTRPFPEKLMKLNESLGISWCFYRGELETDSVKVYQLRKQHRKAGIEGRWEEDLAILNRMAQLLDMNKVENYQYIKSKECMVKFYQGKLSNEETYIMLRSLLELTRKLDFNTEYLVYYSQTELEIIANMAQMLRKREEYNDGIELLELVLGQMTRSIVGYEYQWNGVCFALRVLGGLYFSVGRYEESLKILEYIYVKAMKKKDGDNLAAILDALADTLEHMGGQYSARCQKLYRQAYYVADFFKVHNVKNIIDAYYREKFDVNICWY